MSHETCHIDSSSVNLSKFQNIQISQFQNLKISTFQKFKVKIGKIYVFFSVPNNIYVKENVLIIVLKFIVFFTIVLYVTIVLLEI